MQENIHEEAYREDSSSIDLKKILNVIWGMKWIILLSILACLVAAYAYNRISRTRYPANSKILLVTKNSGGGEILDLTELISGSTNSRVTNELEILRSKSLMQNVVEELGLKQTAKATDLER